LLLHSKKEPSVQKVRKILYVIFRESRNPQLECASIDHACGIMCFALRIVRDRASPPQTGSAALAGDYASAGRCAKSDRPG
jgi:hypothetical protein